MLVTGQLIIDDSPPLQFSQVFQLIKEGATYWVFNDVFRLSVQKPSSLLRLDSGLIQLLLLRPTTAVSTVKRSTSQKEGTWVDREGEAEQWSREKSTDKECVCSFQFILDRPSAPYDA